MSGKESRKMGWITNKDYTHCTIQTPIIHFIIKSNNLSLPSWAQTQVWNGQGSNFFKSRKFSFLHSKSIKKYFSNADVNQKENFHILTMPIYWIKISRLGIIFLFSKSLYFQSNKLGKLKYEYCQNPNPNLNLTSTQRLGLT